MLQIKTNIHLIYLAILKIIRLSKPHLLKLVKEIYLAFVIGCVFFTTLWILYKISLPAPIFK